MVAIGKSPNWSANIITHQEVKVGRPLKKGPGVLESTMTTTAVFPYLTYQVSCFADRSYKLTDA